MSWLGPKLEPRERVVWRDPPLRYSWLMPSSYLVCWVLFSLYVDMFGDKPANPEIVWLLFWTFFVIALVYTPIAFLSERWKVAVTDRRVLRRDGFWRTNRKEMPREAITEIVEDMSTVLLRGGGRKMRLDVGGEAPYLHALLSGNLEATTTVEPAPGEAIMLRLPARWRRWRVMVTDRRIIYRPSIRPPKIQQMLLDDIEDIRRDIVFHSVILRGADRELELRVGPEETNRLLDVLRGPGWGDLPSRP